MVDIVVRDATADDAAACAAIYAPSVTDSAISFEYDVPDTSEFASRIERVQREDPWLVAVVDGEVAGYAYAAPFRARAAYAGTRESTVYVGAGHHGRGLGRLLMDDLIERLRERGAHLVVAGIALPNDASVGLHEALGFKPVGVFREVGRKFDRWHDVGFWQLVL